ncbi:MAG TPA: TonB C-terminal domain-containing protein [Chthoniobacterales bacterium]|nr:TonB C-terminal domain-containing protein [Chthoniobacterales bacterium]
MFDLIGPRWYALMERYGDVVALGKLQVHVVIRADGRIAKIMILSNSSNDAAEKVVRQALAEVKIPPIPPAVIKDLPKRELEMDLAFDLSGSHS